MPSLAELLTLRPRALAHVLCAGHAVDAAALAGWEYRGVSLGLPAFVERLTWKKFKKTFALDPITGALTGHNVRLKQNGLEQPSVPILRRGSPLVFGRYAVVAATGRKMPLPVQQGLLIDYGGVRHPPLDLSRFLRDPIVALEAGDPTRLLGWTFVEVGPLRFGTPSFFLLERECAIAPAPGIVAADGNALLDA